MTADRDAAVVDNVAIRKWKGTGMVKELWKRESRQNVGQAYKGN